MTGNNTFLLRLWLAVLLLCAAPLAAAGAPDVHELRQGWMQLSDSETPPPFPGKGWQPVTLPDNWNRSHPGVHGQGWYHVELTLPEKPSRLWSLYLPRVNMNASAYVNGQPIGSGGRFTEPMAHNWNRPLWFSIPSSLLHKGVNQVDIRLAGYSNDGTGLNPIQAGDAETLEAAYQQRFNWQINGAVFSFFLIAGMACMVFALWLQRRHETVYLMFVLCCAFSAMIALMFVVRDIPFSHGVWYWLGHASVEGYVCSVALFTHRFLGIRRPRAERFIIAYYLAGITAIALAGTDNLVPHFALMHLGIMFLSFYVLITLFQHRKRERAAEVWIVMLALLASASFGYLDLYKLLFSRHENGPLLFFIGPVLLGLAIVIVLLMRFVHTLDQAEALNLELNARVAEKSRELEETYQQLAELEKERAVSGERERIMRDLHDGLGGYLVSALAYSEKGDSSMQPLNNTLRAALGDLRLMIDSLESGPEDMASMLGSVRERLEASMASCGAALIWRVEADPCLPEHGASSALHLMRMVQEAFTNIVKHSQASEAYLRAGGNFIEIADNGKGFDAANAASGRGIGNMRQRASQIGVQFNISSSRHGTRLRFSW